MNTTMLDESIQLSPALASAIAVQKIGEIAEANVRRECGGQLPQGEAAMIEAYQVGLSHQRLVIKGALIASSVGHLLAHLTDLENPRDVEIFYAEADDRVGGPVLELLTDDEQAALFSEAMSLARRLLPIWKSHCAATPNKYA